ncbi:YSIRK-type signal peptide-containing protein [Staphylococcus agnetis]
MFMKDYFRSNKYSIRKFTIGTGSVLIASFFFYLITKF